MSKDFFSQENEVKNSYVKWGKVGDYVKGTLISTREVVNQLKGDRSKQKIYEIKAHDGEFHDINDDKSVSIEITKINEGDMWCVGGKAGLDAQLRNVKLGQIIGLKFVDTVKAKQKGYSDTKIIRCYTAGEIDPEFMEGVGGEVKDDGFGDFGNK